MAEGPEAELKAATETALNSKSAKKLVVAGPGSGKTYLFKKLLEGAEGTADDRLVLTFVNPLKDDLERSLGGLARVYTLHGYAQSLLRTVPALRGGLSSSFVCYPGLRSLVAKDWEILTNSPAPKFVALMRDRQCEAAHDTFYFERGEYYDAVDFDDSVHRVVTGLAENPSLTPKLKLTLVDEFQDFNAMEAALIGQLADAGPIVLAGDDDQALYSTLRNASWDHIRAHYAGDEYENFHLPFCMRCTEVIVGAVNDVITTAAKLKKLAGRIEKPFRYFEPMKGEDSKANPTIDLVTTSVQSAKANYAGRYIEQYLRQVSKEDIAAAEKNHEPVALIIGSKPYLPQVEEHLRAVGLLDTMPEEKNDPREFALAALQKDPKSNLGWRIVLDLGDTQVCAQAVRTAAETASLLADVVPEQIKVAILTEAEKFEPAEAEEQAKSETAMNIATRSYEGSKGLAAQHVFLLGLHEGELPKKATDIGDIEICKFLVGLTRTKKRCTIVITKRFAGTNVKAPSVFLKWIKQDRFARIEVDADYWKK